MFDWKFCKICFFWSFGFLVLFRHTSLQFLILFWVGWDFDYISNLDLSIKYDINCLNFDCIDFKKELRTLKRKLQIYILDLAVI